jgi:hypothetical protein
MNVAWHNRTYPRVDGADDLSCRPDFSIMAYPWQSVAQPPVNGSVERASALNVTGATPPTMLVQAEDDPVHVENALFYWKASAPIVTFCHAFDVENTLFHWKARAPLPSFVTLSMQMWKMLSFPGRLVHLVHVDSALSYTD